MWRDVSNIVMTPHNFDTEIDFEYIFSNWMFPVLKRNVLIDIHFKNPCFLTDKALKSTALQLKL